MITAKSREKFDFAILGTIFTLAWPTMLEQLMQTAVQYIDTAMVGSLGTEATAAVGATGTVSWLIMGVIGAVGIGFLANISQAMGAGKRQLAKQLSGQAVSVTFLLGVLFTCLMLGISNLIPVWMQVDPAIRDIAGTYFFIIYLPMLFRTATMIFGTVLRSVGDTKTPMRVGIIVNITNVLLNYLLIYPTRRIKVLGVALTMFGAGHGVIGAAIASALSFAVGGILITGALFRHDVISPKGVSLKLNLDLLKPCIRIAVPNMFQRFGTSLGFVVFAAMINSLGGVATAAHTIANTVESAFYIPGWGMQAAAATLAGNALGANDNKRLKSLGRTILPLEITLMVICGFLLFVLARPLVMIFSTDEQVIALGTTVLKMVACSEPFYGVPVVIEGLMQGVGKTVAPLIFNVSGMWAVRILGTFITTQLLHYGLVAAWGCMIGHNILLFFLFGYQYLSGKWNPIYDKREVI